MEKPDSAMCHIRQHEIVNSQVKLIIAAAGMRGDRKLKDGKDILIQTLTLTPLTEIWIDRISGKTIRRVELTKTASRYGNIPEPVF